MSKKLIISALAILLCFSVTKFVNADGIPTVTDPKNYPTVWTQSVYNGSGSTIVSGYIVSWDFGTSDAGTGNEYYDDMAMWVKLQATVDGVWTAGVLPYGNDLANGSEGDIIIRGPCYVVTSATAPTAGDMVGAITVLGSATDFTGGTDTCMLGVCILASPAADSCPDESVAGWSIVYVNPSYEAD